MDDDDLALKRKLYARKGIKPEKLEVSRFKGLGEMKWQELRETTLNPDSRKLIQLTLNQESSDETLGLMDMLLSKKACR